MISSHPLAKPLLLLAVEQDAARVILVPVLTWVMHTVMPTRKTARDRVGSTGWKTGTYQTLARRFGSPVGLTPVSR